MHSHKPKEDSLRLGCFSHPYFEQGADRLVVTVSHSHVTLITQLVYVLPPPQNTITPGWDSTLLAECICAQTDRYTPSLEAISLDKWHDKYNTKKQLIHHD